MKIFGYDYKVNREQTRQEMGAMGRHIPASTSIMIAKDMSPSQLESTLLHEIIEAINHHFVLELSERQVLLLETGLYSVLRDNFIDLSQLKTME